MPLKNYDWVLGLAGEKQWAREKIWLLMTAVAWLQAKREADAKAQREAQAKKDAEKKAAEEAVGADRRNQNISPNRFIPDSFLNRIKPNRSTQWTVTQLEPNQIEPK